MDLSAIFSSELKQKASEAKEALNRLVENPKDIEAINIAFRAFHTLKGSASLVGFKNFQKLFHKLEDILKKWKSDPSSLDVRSVLNLKSVLEIVETKRGDLSEKELENVEDVIEGKAEVETKDVEIGSCEGFKETVEWILEELVELETHVSSYDFELAGGVIKILKSKLLKIHEDMEYVPLSKVVEGFDTFVMKDAVDLGKEVEFRVEVEGVKVPNEDVELLRDSLLHIVRNAVVHGIEDPEERKKIGKNERGLVSVRGETESGWIVIYVEDDGRGIDFEKLEEKARGLGITYENPIELLFQPNLSTRDVADEKGGRGVGLDAVKEYVERKGGNISVRTEKGKGTSFEIRIPLKRYLKRFLVLRRENGTFGVEVSRIKGVVGKSEIFERDGKRLTSVDGKIYKVVDLGKGDFHFFVISDDVALAVDEVIGVREAPIKRFDVGVDFIEGFAFGLERFPVPIVDPTKIETGRRESKRKARILVVDDSPLTRLVVSRMLERAGFDVVSAADAKSAISAIDEDSFDYAILDLELPDMSGFDLVPIIRERSPETSIAILTTAVNEENIERARKLGVEFFPKGEDLDELLSFLGGR